MSTNKVTPQQQAKPRHLQNHALSPVQSLPLRSLFRENAGIIWRSIAGTLLFLPFWFAFGFCVALGNTIGSIMAFCGSSRIPQPSTSDLLSKLDAFWVAEPKDNKLPQPAGHIIMKFGDDMTMKDFVDILTNRLINVKNPKGNPPFLYMRFRQRLYPIPGTSRFVFGFSPRFDIANHIHQIPNEVDDMDKFMTFVSNMTGNAFETDKPLWELHVQTDFGPENSGILLFRYHQSITDGQSMIQILFRDVLDGGQQMYQHTKPRFGGLTYASNFCQAVLMAGYIFFTDLMSGGTPDLNLLKYPEIKLSGKYDVIWSEPVNLSVIQRLKSITRSRFNDLIFTALAATLRTYCKMHGISTPADMTACFPVDLRSATGESLTDLKLGNRFVMEMIKLPVSQEAGMPQLWRVRDQMHTLRHSYRHVAYDFLIKILGMAISHKTLQSIINRHYSRCTLLVNSLGGPEAANLVVQNLDLTQLMMWMPPCHKMSIPLSINVITNSDQIQLVVVADTGALKDAYWIAMDFPHEVMALGNLLKTRRVPENHKGGEEVDFESEQAVQASLHTLEERLIKIQTTLRNMRKVRDDIGKVPALWNNLIPELPPEVSPNKNSDESSSGSSGSSSESSSGSWSESGSGSGSSSSSSSGDGEGSDSAKTGASGDSGAVEKPMKLKSPAVSTVPKLAVKPAAIIPSQQMADKKKTEIAAPLRRSSELAKDQPMERRMSNKPLLFSVPRASLPGTGLDETLPTLPTVPRASQLGANMALARGSKTAAVPQRISQINRNPRV